MDFKGRARQQAPYNDPENALLFGGMLKECIHHQVVARYILKSEISVESKSNTSPIRNYGSVDDEEPSKFVLEKNYYKPTDAPLDASLVFEIDRTMKKYVDNLMHAVDS